MEDKKREIRTCGLDIAIREVEGQEGESRTITGTAIVFNAESNVLDDFGVEFREVIKPEAAQMAFLNTQDIKLNLLHDRQDTIARCRMGKGNMRISVDGKGVNFEVDVPKCDIGDRALEMVRAGVYTGCSFEFIPEDYEVEERGANKEIRITHKRFKKITAFTLAMDPAYSQTSVNAREMWNETPTAKREAQEAEEAKQREEEQKREQKAKEKALQREREISAARQWELEQELDAMERENC